MSKGKTKFLSLALLGAVAMMLCAPFAEGAEQTRETYKAEVEPICKVNSEASSRILKGVKTEVQKGKLKTAATKFTKAAAALKKTLKQLKAVPQPTADKAKLEQWLKTIGEEVTLFEGTAKKLKAGNKSGASAMSLRLTSTANRANNLVVGFEFNHCKANTSQYS
jgi:hypothetical protein